MDGREIQRTNKELRWQNVREGKSEPGGGQREHMQCRSLRGTLMGTLRGTSVGPR